MAPPAPPELRTSRLLLRPPRRDDAAALTAILQEPSVARFWHGYDAARVQVDLISPEEEVVFAIEDGGDAGRVIGAIQYSEQPEPDYRHAGVDLFLGTRWQGRGLGGEAIRAVVDHLFDALGHHRVVIDPAVDNERAIRAYERVGFRRVGVLREYERRPDGGYQDGLLMELLRSEHRALAATRHAPAAVPEIALRRATPADVPAILAMMVAFNEGERIAWDPARGEEPLRRLIADPALGRVIAISVAGALAGYAVVSFGFDLEFGGRDAFLTELYLEPGARARGVGRKALDGILEAARGDGVGAIHLQVRADNPAAQRLYRAAGFAGTTRIFLTRLLE